MIAILTQKMLDGAMEDVALYVAVPDIPFQFFTITCACHWNLYYQAAKDMPLIFLEWKD